MVARVIKLIDLIGDASNTEQIEGLLEIITEEATIDEVEEIKAIMNDKLMRKTNNYVRNNYSRALELLE